jgi:hypothetical protein
MKKIAFTAISLIAAGAVFLLSDRITPPPSFDEAKNTMQGRWIFNKAHCDARLPADGLIELRLDDAGITTNRILAKGAWSSANDNDELRETFLAALSELADKCQAELPSTQFAIVKFESFEQIYHFAYTPGAKQMMLLQGDKVIVGSLYDELAIRKLADAIEN